MSSELSVLIVDDDAIIRRIHEVLLSKYGFKKISIVEDGQKAVDLFRSGECYDLVFMDMEMPIKDGPQATQELREMGVDSFIIGVTSRGRDSEKQEFMRAGLNDCYVKPLTTRVVDNILQKLKNNNSSLNMA